MRTITIEEFERDWEAVFEAVEDGETYVVTRDDVPFLKVQPIEQAGD